MSYRSVAKLGVKIGVLNGFVYCMLGIVVKENVRTSKIMNSVRSKRLIDTMLFYILNILDSLTITQYLNLETILPTGAQMTNLRNTLQKVSFDSAEFCLIKKEIFKTSKDITKKTRKSKSNGRF